VKSVTIKIELLSFWHVGSGLGRGADVDALVLKSGDGLPFIPGRTMKGLLREGVQNAEDVGHVPVGRTHALFGRPAANKDVAGSKPGCLQFSDACLPEDECNVLAQENCCVLKAELYSPFASTQLDSRGIAVDHSLRTVELTVPVTLEGRVSGPENGDWQEDLKKAAPLVRALGCHRNRGLGRCRVTVGV